VNKIVERIEREAGVPGLASILAERLTPTDLQSLLLEVCRLRVSRRKPSALLAGYQTNRFVRPSAVAPTCLLRWEQIAFAQLPQEFQPLALSPVCPLGTSSVVAPVAQNWAVATVRNTEVVADSTNVLALECALRRRELLRANPKSTESVHLAASHRLLRGQRYEGPGRVSHFSAFALCSAGRDQGSLQFELSTLALHIRFYLRAIRTFLGSGVPLHLSATDFSPEAREELLETQLLSPICSEFGAVDCQIDGQRTSGRGYYLDLCFHIHATALSGRRLELVDGGSVNWTQQLLSDAKERLVISGLGTERLCTEFASDNAA
jgi:hypothetical protein